MRNLARSIVTFGFAAGEILHGQDVHYQLSPAGRSGTTELHVTMSFAGGADGETAVALPRDNFGVPAMYRFVFDIAPKSPFTAIKRSDDSTLLVTHRPSRPVAISYKVRFDSAQAGFVAFGPSVGPTHYHFLGSQWMARVGSPDSIRTFTVQVLAGDLGDTMAGSFGIGPNQQQRFTTSFDRLVWTVAAGGSYRTNRFTCTGKPLITALRGAFRIPSDSIFAMAKAIACGQRDLWNDHSQPFYSIVITERNRLRAGASYLNAFSCFLRPDSRADQLAVLLAHEMMHAWIPRKLRLVPGPSEPPTVEFSSFHNVRYDWFHEGFTEYIARLLLSRIGLVSEEWLAQRINDDLERLATHPYRTIATAELEDAVRLRRFNNFHQRISYHRGTVLAFNLDAAIRLASDGKQSLIDVVRGLLPLSRESTEITLDRFVAAVGQTGVDTGDQLRQQALLGVPVDADPKGMGAGWVLHFREVPGFEPGFDVIASMTQSVVIGVRPGGRAHAAGLRDGMRIERILNGMPTADDWKPTQPLSVVVPEGPTERVIAFNATTGTIKIPFFSKE